MENKVYEVVLVTRSNITPVGVVKKGDSYVFKLFPGKSFNDLTVDNRAVLQFTNDTELLVKLALNWKVELNIVEESGWRWIEGLPGIKGYVKGKREILRDSFGVSEVLKCSLTPLSSIDGILQPKPVSRADCILLEIGVLYTRFRLYEDSRIAKRLREYLDLYFRLGGCSEIAHYIHSLLVDKGF